MQVTYVRYCRLANFNGPYSPYSLLICASFILFRVPYTLNLLLYYLSIANGTGGIELLVFQCFV